jgi:hypothetical protein
VVLVKAAKCSQKGAAILDNDMYRKFFLKSSFSFFLQSEALVFYLFLFFFILSVGC